MIDSEDADDWRASYLPAFFSPFFFSAFFFVIAQLDARSMSLESGRYMETVGWLSAKLSGPKHKDVTFSRRYLDQNRVTYEVCFDPSRNS